MFINLFSLSEVVKQCGSFFTVTVPYMVMFHDESKCNRLTLRCVYYFD